MITQNIKKEVAVKEDTSIKEPVVTDPDAATRQPVKGQTDALKIVYNTPGWHEDKDGKWYQNPDGTFYINGFQDIDGYKYLFDKNGYVKTGWVTKGFDDYYFNDDGVYDPNRRKPMIALTFDDGPGQYTDKLLRCLEENNAHATFFMLGQNVSSYQDTVKKMYDIGCELGSHSWDHTQLTSISLDAVAKQYNDTDNALIKACGQPATVARTPYGAGNSDIFSTVNKPFFMWSLDTLDWSNMDTQMNIKAVMDGDLTDGSIILMHDIHEPSVEAALTIIPSLIKKGYKLVTVSELAAAKGVTLQSAEYSDFWDSSLSSGNIAGYAGNTEINPENGSGDPDESENKSEDKNLYDKEFDDYEDS